MTSKPEPQEESGKKLPFYKRFKEPGKQVFWVWIAYQCVKGMTTTTLIWIPMLYVWWHNTH